MLKFREKPINRIINAYKAWHNASEIIPALTAAANDTELADSIRKNTGSYRIVLETAKIRNPK